RYGRRSAARLVGVSLFLALGALVLLDRYSLPHWKRDRATRNFFMRVERRLAPGDRLYSFELNEDVLGWACLELSHPPAAENEPNRLIRELEKPGAFLLAEAEAISRFRAAWADSLEMVVRGRAGSRAIALYRMRTARSAPPGRLSDETKAFAHAVREQEPSHDHGQEHRRYDGRDLRSRRLADPERLLRDDPL